MKAGQGKGPPTNPDSAAKCHAITGRDQLSYVGIDHDVAQASVVVRQSMLETDNTAITVRYSSAT